MAEASSANFMPYAPAEPVLRIVRRYRERGLPDAINRRTLPQLGVAEGNSDRIEKTLAFLGLIDEDGHRTEGLERLGKASSEDYPKVFGEIVQRSYSPIFAIVNPQEDSLVAIHDAFRPYEPPGQRARMVSLFLGLCKEAGIVSGGPVQRKSRGRRSSDPAKANAKSVVTPKPADQTTRGGVEAGEAKHDGDDRQDASSLDLRLLSGLMQQLPKDARWTHDRRERWLQAVTATVDLLIEVDRAERPE